MKIDPIDIRFEPLSDSSDLSDFDCGDADLNDFLRTDALKNQNVYISKTRLAYYRGNAPLTSNSGRQYKGEVLGFITLVTDSIEQKRVRKVERGYVYPFYPALKIARLGIHHDYKRRGMGTALLDEAFSSAVSIFHKSHTGCRLITVDSKHTPDAMGFYESFGFTKALKKDRKDIQPVAKYLGVSLSSLRDDTVPMYIDYARYFDLI